MRHQQPPRAFALLHAAAHEQPHQAMLLIASFGELVLALVLFLAGLTPLAQQMPEQHSTGAPAAQDAAADQQAYEVSVLIAPLGELVLALVFFLPGLAPLAQQVPEQHAAGASASQDAAADQQAHEAPVLIAPFGELFLTLVFFLSGLAVRAQQVPEQHAAHPPAPQQPAADQQANQPALLSGLLLARGLLAFLFFLLRLAALAQQMCEQQVAQSAPTQQPAADQQTHDASALLFAFSFFTLQVVVLGLMSVTDEPGEQCTAQASTAHRLATESKACQILFLQGSVTHKVLLTLSVRTSG